MAYPPGEKTLVWEVFSTRDQTLPVVISYLIRGLDHLVVHEAVVDPAETRLNLASSLVVRNFSGEDFVPARIWLDKETFFDTGSHHLETQQLFLGKTQDLPVVKRYLWDSGSMPKPGAGIALTYEIPGTGPRVLAPGKTRVFRKEDSGRVFLGENAMEAALPGERTLLTIGDSREVTVSLKRMKTEKTDVRKNNKGEVQVYNEVREEQILAENFKAEAVTLTLTLRIPGQWEPLDMGHPYTLTDHETLVFNLALAPGEQKTLSLSYRLVHLLAGKFSRHNR